ncbi:MAG: exodeoxyribonuclease III [Bacteroidota bacterium]
MKIISYNVNGIRAAMKKGLVDWMEAEQPDVLCLQETKATPEQVDVSQFEKLGYNHYWESAEKKGYSGVAILSKQTPEHVEIGSGIPHFDSEGRVIRADFADFSLMNVYIPSGTSGEERQAFKMKWLDEFYDYAHQIAGDKGQLIIVGDYNIAHTEMDIHNPKGNKNNSGFLPEEREWVTKFLDSGFIDTYRHLNPDTEKYSWWTYRFNARKNNKGWRIDYQAATKNMEARLKRAESLNEVFHSDHCPTLLEIE